MFKKINLEMLEELDKNITKSLMAKQNHKVERLKAILQKPNSLVTHEDVEDFILLISEIRFFQERKEMEKRDLKELLAGFQVIDMAANKNVINYGEPGEKFYVILSGQVSVKIPNPGIKGWKDHRAKFD